MEELGALMKTNQDCQELSIAEGKYFGTSAPFLVGFQTMLGRNCKQSSKTKRRRDESACEQHVM